MIHKALQNEEKFSSDTLAAELEVSSRTITRDIKLMQDLLGMPVEWDPGEHSFVYTRPCDTLPLLCLNRREALVFAVIAHVVNGWLGAALGSELDGIMKKITPAFGGAVDLDPDALQRVLTLPDADDLHELDHFLPLLEALLAHEQVAIEYRKSATHPVERRRVDPLQLALQEGAWLLVTHDHARAEVRRFLLTRIRQVTRTGTTFEPPRGFDVKKYLRDSLGRYGGTEEHEVRFALDAHAANYARQKAWHPSQQLTERKEGGAELTLRLNHLAGAKHLALNWAEHVEVLSPPALRHDVRKSLAAALAKYG